MNSCIKLYAAKIFAFRKFCSNFNDILKNQSLKELGLGPELCSMLYVTVKLIRYNRYTTIGIIDYTTNILKIYEVMSHYAKKIYLRTDK